ncbi:hypothetical protein VCSRO111_2757 [Vibrio cholerae]|nr:hypothetical protein SAMEA4374365_00175 [Vibrio cholerae]BCK02120.1 hypothetical protein VCSRO162_0181 [Vibrio cholerae]GHW15805.1 hypothetical protein VCSRO192_3135 [Vibrio cholerae]GHX01030.1 hypothetical protein VCSRO155_3269 [Vibrio cholerae]GHX24967.1 hypothetical protein VCSRO107_2238 [Vibrio cholerae]
MEMLVMCQIMDFGLDFLMLYVWGGLPNVAARV